MVVTNGHVIGGGGSQPRPGLFVGTKYHDNKTGDQTVTALPLGVTAPFAGLPGAFRQSNFGLLILADDVFDAHRGQLMAYSINTTSGDITMATGSIIHPEDVNASLHLDNEIGGQSAIALNATQIVMPCHYGASTSPTTGDTLGVSVVSRSGYALTMTDLQAGYTSSGFNHFSRLWRISDTAFCRERGQYVDICTVSGSTVTIASTALLAATIFGFPFHLLSSDYMAFSDGTYIKALQITGNVVGSVPAGGQFFPFGAYGGAANPFTVIAGLDGTSDCMIRGEGVGGGYYGLHWDGSSWTHSASPLTDATFLPGTNSHWVNQSELDYRPNDASQTEHRLVYENGGSLYLSEISQAGTSLTLSESGHLLGSPTPFPPGSFATQFTQHSSGAIAAVLNNAAFIGYPT
jgi:hypothetical protein